MYLWCLRLPAAFLFAGIWYEWADEVKEICAAGDLTVSRVHTHIGSGSDPAVWQKVGIGRTWRTLLCNKPTGFFWCRCCFRCLYCLGVRVVLLLLSSPLSFFWRWRWCVTRWRCCVTSLAVGEATLQNKQTKKQHSRYVVPKSDFVFVVVDRCALLVFRLCFCVTGKPVLSILMLFLAQVSGMSLDLVRQFPDVTTLNLGGGYKVGVDVWDGPFRCIGTCVTTTWRDLLECG